MKKLLLVVAVLATSSLALAAPAFTLPTSVDLIAGGVPVDVTVGVTNVSGVQGMVLYLGTDAPLTLSGLVVNDVGLFTSANSNPAFIEQVDAQTMSASLSTTGTNVITAASGNVARITIVAPAGTPNGDYSLSTSLPAYGVESDFAGVTAGQATAVIHVTPEPMSALLLLAGLPLLRRRHA